MLRDTKGANLVEYVLLVGLVAIVALAGFRKLGGVVQEKADAQSRRVLTLEGVGEGDDGTEKLALAAPKRARAASASTGSLGHESPELVPVCFAAGTLVATPRGARAIEQIAPGEVVLSRDAETGATRPRTVSRTFTTPDREIVEVDLISDAGGETLETTAEHPFRVARRGWVAAAALAAGDRVERLGGAPAVVAGVSKTGRHETVFNLEVEEQHTYFVGHTGALVHNDCEPPRAPGTTIKAADDAFADFRGVGERKKGKDFWVAESGSSTVAFGYTAALAIDSDAATNVARTHGKGIDYVDEHYARRTTVKFQHETTTTVKGKTVTQTITRPIPANEIAYVALPPHIYMARDKDGDFVTGDTGPMGKTQVRPGDYVRVTYGGRTVYAIFVDAGPSGELGEVSMKVAEALHLKQNPNSGGLDTQDVRYDVLPGSGPAVPGPTPDSFKETLSAMTNEEIQRRGHAAFDDAAAKGWLPRR